MKTLRLLIFAANPEAQGCRRILSGVPRGFAADAVEVLVICDAAGAAGLFPALRKPPEGAPKATLLETPEDQGYGGTQKLACRYAVEQDFDVLALLPGAVDPSEALPALLQPLMEEKADAVFAVPAGSSGDGLRRKFHRLLLGCALPDFRARVRVYRTEALRQVPFERNSSDVRFDTDIAVQLALKNLTVIELPLPVATQHLRHPRSLRYTMGYVRTLLRARLHQMNLFFSRKFDVQPPEKTYDLKVGFPSSHTAAIAAARPGGHVLDVGCGQGYVGAELVKKGCRVTGMDRHVPPEHTAPEGMDFIRWDLDRNEFPVNVSQFDQIFLLDIIEHLRAPDEFMDQLRYATGCRRPEVILTTANIGFLATRLMLLFGQFNYGKRGILDATHTRLFTFRSIRELLQQSGYKILEMRGIPAPFPKALGDNFASRALLRLNEALIRVSMGLFAYQILVRAEALPTVRNLLNESVDWNAPAC